MIYIAGAPFITTSSQDDDEGMDTFIDLMEHPVLVSASNEFKSIPQKKISINSNSQSKLVYIFQREFATVDPALVDLVGTDEATTCIGIVIRNPNTGIISVAHMDFPNIVEEGLRQMLALVADDSDALLDVHMIGGFDDVSSQQSSDSDGESEGYSYLLCAKIIEMLTNRTEKFQIQTLHVLGHNTRHDSQGIAYPIFQGFVVETSSGVVIPAIYDETSRCPDEVVRRIRVTAAYEDPNWTGRLLETYDTKTDRYTILPCAWTMRQSYIASTLQSLSDNEVLQRCSTSPLAENPDFIDNERRKWDYLIRYPDWGLTFPSREPRVFRRSEDGKYWAKL